MVAVRVRARVHQARPRQARPSAVLAVHAKMRMPAKRRMTCRPRVLVRLHGERLPVGRRRAVVAVERQQLGHEGKPYS
eukprot:1397340-Prymnesium_polylepis.1